MAPKVTWVAPDGGWGWVITVCSLVLHAQSLGLLLSLGVMYVSWLEEFGDGRGATSWVISIAITMAFSMGPVPAALANLYGFRVVTIAGSLLISVGFILGSFATSIPFLVVTIGLIAGTGCCFLYLTAVAVVNVYFCKRRSVAMGLGTSGTGVGVLISGPFLHYLINEYGWRGTLLITGAISLHACAFGLLIRPLKKIRICEQEEGDEKEKDRFVDDAQDIQINESNPMLVKNQQNTDLIHHSVEDTYSQKSLVAGKSDVPSFIIEKIGNGATNSMNQSRESLIVPHSKKPVHYLDKTRSNSMMKMHNGSLLSVNKAHVYCSLRSLNSKSKHSSAKQYNIKHPSMDVVFANSIKRLGSISLIGTLPNGMIENNSELNLANSLETGSNLNSVLEDIECDRSLEKSKQCCPSFGQKLKDAINHNIELLRDPTFLLFGISNIATNLSYAPPVMYLVDRAVDSGLDKTSGAMLVAMNGIGNIIGRLFFGAITYRVLKDRIMTYVAVLALAGLFTSISPICGGSMVLHGIYAIIIGSLLGGYCTLVAVTTVDLMGVEKASGSFGLLLSFFGIGTLLGPPFGGILFDWTQSYTVAYILYGIFLITSALIVLPTACVRRKRRKTQEKALKADMEYKIEQTEDKKGGGEGNI